MAIDVLKRVGMFLILWLAQALVLNRIQLFGCAVPLLSVYFIIQFPRNYPRCGLLLWGFVMGLLLDVFANTPGVASASMTLVAFLQPYLLELFKPRDAEENLPSSAKALGWDKYLPMAILLVFIYCLAFFSLEAFSFFNWLHWLECVAGSTVLTSILIVTLESARK